MINVGVGPKKDALSVRDLINESLREADPLPYDDWEEEWKTKYSSSRDDTEGISPY
jgi:hypothetical protein